MKSQFIKYDSYNSFEISEMISRSNDFFEMMNKRRTVREFSDKTVPYEVIEN